MSYTVVYDADSSHFLLVYRRIFNIITVQRILTTRYFSWTYQSTTVFLIFHEHIKVRPFFYHFNVINTTRI